MSHTDDTEIVLRLAPELVKQIDQIAAYLEENRASVINQALRHYLAHEGADLLDEAEGFAELDRGEGVPLADVLAEARRIAAAAGKKRAS